MLDDAGKEEIKIDEDWLRIARGGSPILEYHYRGKGLFKPYVAALHLPGGINPLRDAPHDHLHHHALMLAWNVNDVEFWGPEDAACGNQIHEAFSDVRVTAAGATFTERLQWKAPSKDQALLLEERTISHVPLAGQDAALIDWKTSVSVPPGKGTARLSGREYHGLGVRFVIPMDKVGKFQNSEGATAVEGTNKKRARWCSYSGPTETGQKVTAAFFDHPSNPRSPADWFTMIDPFAYMTATLGLDEKPIEIKEGEKLAVRYGVALFAGEASREAIDALYKEWIERSPR